MVDLFPIRFFAVPVQIAGWSRASITAGGSCGLPLAIMTLRFCILRPWDEELIAKEGALPVCGEGCAQKLQSQFMGNLRENEERRRA